MNGKYTLHVSYDAGVNYQEESHAESPELFKPELERLDAAGLRWMLTDPNGDHCVEYACAIHRSIVNMLRSGI